MSEPDALTQIYERSLMADLNAINAHGLTGDKNEQGPLWPAKERVALFKVVADYLAGKRKLDGPGPMGGALGGGTDG